MPMLKSDVRALETAIASVLRLKMKRVREILATQRNRDSLYFVRNSLQGCVVVPKPDDSFLVVFAARPGGGFWMATTIAVDQADLAAWAALPASQRALPEGLPAH